MSTQEQRRNYRRRVLMGFPKEAPFDTPEALAAYFATPRLVCLRCGKTYRRLSRHLVAIHDMEPDEYRKIYGIPWTYGLDCAETTEILSDNMSMHLATGVIIPVEGIYKMATHTKRKPRQPIQKVWVERNLEKMNAGKDGTRQPDKRSLLSAKRGTPEFHQKMIDRPQTQSEERKNFLRTCWIGREQTDEHVFKRTGFHKKCRG